jgi:hypothetical protein
MMGGTMLDRQEQERIAAVIRQWRHPWWWRLRRRVAFFVGLRCRVAWLGYLIDVDRDRHRDV